MRSHFGAGRRRFPIVPHVRYATKRRHVSFAPVCTKRRGATCDARNTAAPAPSRTVHCRMFPLCRASVATRDDDTFPLRPVCTKRRGATPDARNTAASAPSWTVHRRMSTLIYAVNEGHRRKKSGERLPGRQECVNLARLVSSRPKSGVPAGTHNETHTFLYYNLITQSTNH